jgi:hypothetical protein
MLAILAIVGIVAFAFHSPILRSLGGVLVRDDALQTVDVIVVPQWLGDSGAIEGADLVKSGIASRVAVLPEPPRPAERELARRGVQYPDETADVVRVLELLGVTNVEVISTLASSTEAEGRVLVTWCDANRLRQVLVLSTPDHSRRVRRVLDRSFRGHATKILIRSTRYSTFDPAEWWKTRDGLRIGIVELQKLLLDYARHPLS